VNIDFFQMFATIVEKHYTHTYTQHEVNVHNFPTTLQQQKKCIFVPFKFIIFTSVVKKGKEKNEVDFILFFVEN
jgi:CRISPR/Cas system endoribonuclease Cas6 (RAMP superfamily)